MSESANQPQTSAMQRWQKIARRIRVPLGFLTAGLYVFELYQRAPRPIAVAWSLALVLPGLWLRAYASGYVKKNAELTVTGPYAYTRNPLYLGSMLIAAGFALALESWAVAALLTAGFAIIYIPVIAGEERFLRANFPGLRPAQADHKQAVADTLAPKSTSAGNFSFALYRQHREYNAAIGAALLYLCLVALRPALAAIFSSAR
jgi:protein-S-isoprenylcysteine O-methyltransferase Ste14